MMGDETCIHTYEYMITFPEKRIIVFRTINLYVDKYKRKQIADLSLLDEKTRQEFTAEVLRGILGILNYTKLPSVCQLLRW